MCYSYYYSAVNISGIKCRSRLWLSFSEPSLPPFVAHQRLAHYAYLCCKDTHILL